MSEFPRQTSENIPGAALCVQLDLDALVLRTGEVLDATGPDEDTTLSIAEWSPPESTQPPLNTDRARRGNPTSWPQNIDRTNLYRRYAPQETETPGRLRDGIPPVAVLFLAGVAVAAAAVSCSTTSNQGPENHSVQTDFTPPPSKP
jgi:hypothetical protein